MNELKEKFSSLKKRFQPILSKFDPDKAQQELRKLEAKTLKSDFWKDVLDAQKTMQKIADLKEEIKEFDSLKGRLDTLGQLLDLSQKELEGLDLENEINQLEKLLVKKESTTFLSGKYDQGNCIISIHAGQGGVEAMDWTAMLSRMYQRYAQSKGWLVNLIEETQGEEAGLKSVTFEVVGKYAYGFLKKESGTHRLVRLSPFNADKLRQTSFALVEVLPLIEGSKEIEIKESDLEFETFRSSGPGGQNVQKVSTAVRLRHLPTNITVTCQSERSQYQNKENALKILKAKLFQLEELKDTEKEKQMKTWEKTASWGTQIRSYVLHPYKLVKDLRTKAESADAESVLDGDLDTFIDAEIKL